MNNYAAKMNSFHHFTFYFMTDTFYDQGTGVRFDVHFEPDFANIQDEYAAQKTKFEEAIQLINRMENGEIVNHTAVKSIITIFV